MPFSGGAFYHSTSENVSWTNTSTRKRALRPRAKPAKRVKSPARLRPPPTSSQLPPMLDQADHPMKSLLAVKFVCEKHQFTMPVPLDTPFREEFPKLANCWNLLGVSRKPKGLRLFSLPRNQSCLNYRKKKTNKKKITIPRPCHPLRVRQVQLVPMAACTDHG